MSYLKAVCGLLALLMTGMAWSADTLTPEQKEVKQFIEKMYSYDPGTFEFGEFSKKDGSPFLLNKVPKNGGKYDPSRHCELLREFFDESQIEKRTIRPGLIGCGDGHLYYLDSMELSPDTRVEDIKTPDIRTPVVKDSKAMVFVFFGKKTKAHEYASDKRGMTGHLLTKGEKGWRVRLAWFEPETMERGTKGEREELIKISPDNRSKKWDSCVFEMFYSSDGKLSMEEIRKKCK